MRFAVKREDERLRRLVDALDVETAPMAETWRLVGAAASASGSPRPSYPLVRRLVLARRAEVRAREELRRIALEAAETVLVGRVPDVWDTLDRLEEAWPR